MPIPKLCIAQDPDADQLLSESPFALLVGMMLDQQIPLEVAFRGPKKIADRMAADLQCVGTSQQIAMEVAFAGPKKIADRIGGFDAELIAGYNPDKFVALCSETPAIHRFPGSMSKRVQALAQIIVDEYDGDAAAVWTEGNPDGREVFIRLKKLPGFGDQKAKIFLALLGKQYGMKAKGWEEVAGDYGKKGTFVSVADIRDQASLDKVRSHKKQMKAAAKAKA